MESMPIWAKHAHKSLETVSGTVSSKVEEKPRKFRYVCYDCKTHGHKWMQDIVLRGLPNKSFLSDAAVQARAFPKRCKKCRSRQKKWTNAANVFVKLDLLRMNEGYQHLRFVTFTRKEWNLFIPLDELSNKEFLREEHKKKCIRSFRNWRDRNSWWQSREAMGQYWPECTEKAVWDGYGFEGIELHFHTHCILVSKYLDNRPKGLWHLDQNGKPMITEDSKFYKEWGGIVDVRSVKDYQVKYQHKGETRKGCGRKACMNYLVKYITKADGWKSAKIGKW